MLDRGEAGDPGAFLSALARSCPKRLKAMAEAMLPRLGAVEVVQSRTGLVMLPFRDTVRGKDFFLGEVLVAEAHIRASGIEGYGMVTGRDLERAMAMAVLDAGRALGLSEVVAFAAREAAVQAEEDTALLRRVEATRVEMETF
ncbi:phosphonate C-P lyase system protein PhnG [Tabrizicola sp. TH137]|uniref:phosphonate C-P lyase system protein PhnG n=1 Tax=Tabrizicola sp. TH137 TaxID=2067452 RepID=UPI000C7B64FE|nr:phosphonate C-P lyase system protein PhnG [Tabrizicola sp. TH137]PLL12508.1 phosphonate C-P lyase system protein PhnG [Tabrizicola sp. TH137]